MPIIDARYYKTILVCPHKAIGNEIAPLLAQGLPLAPVQRIQEYLNRRGIVDLMKAFEPKICFLDLATNVDAALQMLADLLAVNPSLAVIGLLPGNNADLILRCLRAGAADFLIRPFTDDQMDTAVEKIARLLPPPTQRSGNSSTIAILPAKGACGATTVACNLAFQLKRTGFKRVLLADLDPLTGTISFLLKLRSSHSFVDALTRRGSLDGDLFKQMVTSSNGVDVLVAPDNPMDGLDSLQDASEILHFAQNLYDVVVTDAGDATSEWSLSIARNADEVLLVTTNELAALQSAQRALNHLEACHVPMSRVRVVVNRYDKELGLRSEIIPQALDTEVFQVIPSDFDSIQKSLIEGKPVASGTTFGKSVSSLSERLGISPQQEGKGDDDKGKGGLLGKFFSRN
jgi:pilus assembly protein CpaE